MTWRAVACAIVMVCAATTGARAQVIAMLDPSARAGGMGGASVAVGWNGPGNGWLNPALVATGRGCSVQASTQQLLPGIADDLKLRASSFAVSYAGVALACSGRPFGGETLVMPFGRVAVDSFGNFISASGWLESMASRSAAVSFAGVADAALAVLGHSDARLSDWGDIAWGRTWKRTDSALGFYGASLTARDEG